MNACEVQQYESMAAVFGLNGFTRAMVTKRRHDQ